MDFAGKLRQLVHDRSEDGDVRAEAVQSLVTLGAANLDVVALRQLVLDRSEDFRVRVQTAKVLFELQVADEGIKTALRHLVVDPIVTGSIHKRVTIADALGDIGRGDAHVVATLRELVLDRRNDSWLRGRAANALVVSGNADADILAELHWLVANLYGELPDTPSRTNLLDDRRHANVWSDDFKSACTDAAKTLVTLGATDTNLIATLQQLLYSDPNDEHTYFVPDDAAEVLVMLFQHGIRLFEEGERASVYELSKL